MNSGARYTQKEGAVNMLWKRPLVKMLVLYLILGSWKGYVALFEKGKEEPRQIFPCLVDSLPEEDQQILKDGLPIHSPKALQEALEDYLS